MSLLDRYTNQQSQEIAEIAESAARRVAYVRAQQNLKAMSGICQMIDDFEELATTVGLPAGAYEVFEKAHIAIGRALLELNRQIAELDPHAA